MRKLSLLLALLLAQNAYAASRSTPKGVALPSAVGTAPKGPAVVASAAATGAKPISAAAKQDALPAAVSQAAAAAPPEGKAEASLSDIFDGHARACAHCSHGDEDDSVLSLQDPAASLPPHLKPYLPSKRDAATWTQEITFHLHSYFSDGTMSPEAVVDLAHSKGVRVLALSDHDTTAGLLRAWARAKELGVEFHPAVEMTARGGVHVGAVDIDISNPKIIALGERMRIKRLQHAESMVAKLNALPEVIAAGVTITIDEVRAMSKHDEGGTIELPHLARVLLEKGLISSVDEAFDKFLKGGVLDNKGGMQDPTVDEVLKAIKAAGGKAFLNHPFTVRGADQRSKDAAVEKILKKGVAGIEVYRAVRLKTPQQRKRADGWAAKNLAWMDRFGLLAGNGADFHGADTHLDQLAVWMPKVLADKLLEALKDANALAIAALARLSGLVAKSQ